MHPAFSVIFFTTLSGAGYGLLFWCALAALSGRAHASTLAIATALALVLVTVGLLSSLGHLGKPSRAWRAFSQWRSSWLSREGVAAVVTYVPALAFGALAFMQAPAGRSPYLPVDAAGAALCLALAGCALATIGCTAMIYASLKPIPAWRHRLVVPGYLVFALLTGATLLATLVAWREGDARAWNASIALAAVIALVLKSRYWHAIDRTPLPVTRGDAIGLPSREASVFERPHTQGNYLTREMGFVLARRHAARLRGIALLLFGLLPLLMALCAWWLPATATAALPVAAGAALLGTLVERWLFFAQARHLVTLYY